MKYRKIDNAKDALVTAPAERAAIAEGYLPFSTGEIINTDGGFYMRLK